MTRQLLELERHLSALEKAGQLPVLSDYAKNTSADPPPLPRAAA
jgi:hypothetical protein